MVHSWRAPAAESAATRPTALRTDYRTPEFFQSRDRLRCRVDDAKEVQRPLLEDITSDFVFR
jgi:hypothetical protein